MPCRIWSRITRIGLMGRASFSRAKIKTMVHQKMTFSESSRNDIIPSNIFGKKFNITMLLPFSRELLSLIRHCLLTRWKYTMKNVCVKRILTSIHGVSLIITRRNMKYFSRHLICCFQEETNYEGISSYEGMKPIA